MRSLKNRAQNIECIFSCVARSAVLLRPNVTNILLFNFCEQKFLQHGPITIAIDCNGLCLLIFEEKWSIYVAGPKSTLNSDSFRVRRLFNVCVRVFCAPNNGISLLIFEEKWPNYASELKSELNRDPFWVRRLFNVCVRVCNY